MGRPASPASVTSPATHWPTSASGSRSGPRREARHPEDPGVPRPWPRVVGEVARSLATWRALPNVRALRQGVQGDARVLLLPSALLLDGLFRCGSVGRREGELAAARGGCPF